MFENYKKTPKIRQSNPRLGLLRSSFLLLIIRITLSLHMPFGPNQSLGEFLNYWKKC